MINTMSKIRGQEKGPGYPQAETVLGEAMQKYGRELGEESSFGKLIDIHAPSTSEKDAGEVQSIRILQLAKSSCRCWDLKTLNSRKCLDKWLTPHLEIVIVEEVVCTLTCTDSK